MTSDHDARGRSELSPPQARSTHGSRPNSRPNSRPTSRQNSPTRAGSRPPGSRPVSWLVQTNSEYANMYENYGGTRSQDVSDAEDDHSHAERGAPRKPKSRAPSIIKPSNEKIATPGSNRPSMLPTFIKEDYATDDSSNSSVDEVEVPPVRGTVTPLKASFLLGKAFVGTGVLFLPKAFRNGGKASTESVNDLSANTKFD